MKRLIPLFLSCLLLCGCMANAHAQQLPTTQPTTVPTTAPTQAAETASVPAETVTQTEASGKGVRLPVKDAYHILSLGENLVVFSGTEGTVMTLLKGDDLSVISSRALEFFLDASDPSVRVCDGELTYFDPVNRQTVVLDSKLSAVSHIAAPEDLVGSPILSADRNILYYCTQTAIRAWNLETGIRRMLKELSYPQQALSGLHQDDQVVQCTVDNGSGPETLFVSVEDGTITAQQKGEVSLLTLEDRYFATFPVAATTAHVFGTLDSGAQMFLPEDPLAQVTFLPDCQGAAVWEKLSETQVQVQYYDLASGCLTDTLTLESDFLPAGVVAIGQDLYVLIFDSQSGYYTLHRWQPSLTPLSDTVYTGTYDKAPDTAALAQCQKKADEIGAKYGITILVGDAAVAVQPWDYDLTEEFLVPVIERELDLLDQRLTVYPGDMLSVIASHFDSLSICLVRQITGTAESGSLDSANGLQFLEDGNAYIAITAGKYSQQSLYHEMYHAMETHILTESTALDQWETLNPEDFAYDYSVQGDSSRDSSVYLAPETRAFVDAYSMSFPIEDRARILENAMLPDKEELFQTDTMQAKLSALCQGIRDSFDLPEEPCLWEQYLRQPAA